jgi:hypothetical protein
MKLSTKTKDSLPNKEFALPDQHKFPIPDARHAANAKARATQGVKNGTLSKTDAAKVRSKANRVLGEK